MSEVSDSVLVRHPRVDDIFFFFSSRRRHTRCSRDWSSDVCSSDLSKVVNDKEVQEMNEATQKVVLQEGSQSAEKRAYVARAFAAGSPTSGLAAATIRRREPGPDDVQIGILYCGVCHSDLHQVRNEWSDFMPTVYPCVPGHEIVGRVTKVGSAVSKFKLGDIAAVGRLVDSDPCFPG